MTGSITHCTWHPVEQSLPCAVVGLQEAAVYRPVQMGDEARGFVALAYFFKALRDSIGVHQAVIRPHSQVGAIWRKLQLMNHFLPVLDVDHFCHIPEKNKEQMCDNIMAYELLYIYLHLLKPLAV